MQIINNCKNFIGQYNNSVNNLSSSKCPKMDTICSAKKRVPLNYHKNIYFAGRAKSEFEKKMKLMSDGGYSFEYAPKQKVHLYKGSNKSIIWVDSDNKKDIFNVLKNIDFIKKEKTFNKIIKLQYSGDYNTEGFFRDLRRKDAKGRPIYETVLDLSKVKKPVRINSNKHFNNLLKHYEEYKYGDAFKNSLHIFKPNKEKDNNKLLIYVHGGGFLGGHPLEEYNQHFYKSFVDEGYTVASVGYRLMNEAPFYLTIEDIAKGITSAKNLLGKNKKQVVLSGYSAGATGAELLLYSDKYPSIPKMDRFFGMSGGFGDKAILDSFNTHCIKESVQHRSYSDLIKLGNTPKTMTPALLISGLKDENDKFHGGMKSRVVDTYNFIEKGAPAKFIYSQGKFDNHIGPQEAITQGDKFVVSALKRFLRTKL